MSQKYICGAVRTNYNCWYEIERTSLSCFSGGPVVSHFCSFVHSFSSLSLEIVYKVYLQSKSETQNQKLSKSTNTTHFPSYRSFFVQSHVHPCQCLSTSDVFQKMFKKKDEVFFSYVENASNRYGVILTCLPSNHAAPFGPRQAMQEIFQTGCTVKDLGEFRNVEISPWYLIKTYKKHGIPNFFDMLSTVSQHFRKLSSYLPRGLMNVHLSRWKTIDDMVCKQVDLVFPLGSFMQNTNFGWLVTGWTMERSVLAWLARDLVPSQLLKCWLCRLGYVLKHFGPPAPSLRPLFVL